MNTKSKIAVALVLTLAGVLAVRYALESESPAASAASNDALAASETSAESSSSASEPKLSTEETIAARAAAGKEPSPPTAVVATPTVRLRGSVLDANASPLAALRVKLAPETLGSAVPEQTAFTERDGRFEMDPPRTSCKIVVDDSDYTTVMAGLYRPHASIEPIVVAAPAQPLAGRVRAADGTPLAGASVDLRLDNVFGTRFAHVLDASMQRDWNATSDERGAFDLGSTPRVEGAELVTRLAGYVSDVRKAPDAADRALDIVLAPVEMKANVLTGDVRLPDGAPAARAHVAFGGSTLFTDEAGRFSFDLAEGDGENVVAVQRGYLPAELAASPSAPRWPEFVRLRLGASPNALAGRVVDANGNPRAKIRVWLADPTYFGNVEGTLTHVEHLLAGAPTNAEVEARRAALNGAYEGPDLFWSFFETDAHGSFRIEGLMAREYRLKALDPKSLAQIEAGPFAAGSERIELELDASSEYEKVSGRVLAREGTPVPGVHVSAARRVVTIQGDGWTNSRGHGGASTVTDAEGRFELEHVAREGIFLTAHGDAILPTWFDFPEKAKSASKSLENVEIHAVRRCHVQVDLTDRMKRADAFAVLDGGDERLDLSIIRGENDSTADTIPLIDGRSPVVAVGENGTTIVLLLDNKEVERHPLSLKPGELSVVRP